MIVAWEAVRRGLDVSNRAETKGRSLGGGYTSGLDGELLR
jgi:hypothetical protein